MATQAQQAIATLIELAQDGKIDPWDVQVIDVIDQFLSDLGLTGKTEQVLQESDLSQSGQTFLWASKLVLLKADTLENLTIIQEETTEDGEDLLGDWQDESGRRLPIHLENHIRRRAAALPPKRRRVTLQEFIEQIQQIANEIEDNQPKVKLKRPRQLSQKDAIKQITQLAHDENLTDLAIQLEQFFQTQINTDSENDYLELETLVQLWTNYQQEHTFFSKMGQSVAKPLDFKHEKVGVFWALLLLSSQSKVELEQESFYQNLKVRPLHQI